MRAMSLLSFAALVVVLAEPALPVSAHEKRGLTPDFNSVQSAQRANPVYPPELRSLVQNATKGDTDAQLELARRYEYGYGLPVNHERAFYWHERALFDHSDMSVDREVAKFVAPRNAKNRKSRAVLSAASTDAQDHGSQLKPEDKGKTADGSACVSYAPGSK